MTLSAVYFSPPIGGIPQAMRHPSGRVYNPNGSNQVTVPIADALSWGSGASGNASTLPPGAIFQNQMLLSTTAANPMFLWFTGITADRTGWSVATPFTTQAYGPPPFGSPFYDTTLAAFSFWVGPGYGSTNWMNQAGSFV